MKKFYVVLFFVWMAVYAFPRGYYVDAGAAAGGDGSSWSTAYDSLHKALAVSAGGDTVYVAEGVYKPPTDTDRTACFQMPSGVVMIGGYPTGGGIRDWTDRRSILSGDIGTAEDPTDNTYHVIMCNQTSPATVIDGFYITGGYADGSGDDGAGGGICVRTNSSRYYGVTIIRCHIYDNYAGTGGGVNIDQKGEIYFSVIENNRAGGYGGGVNIHDDGRAYNTVIRNNYAVSGGGGVNISGFNTAPGLINCIISNNETAGSGSGIRQGESRVINCNIVNNKGGYGVQQSTYARIANSIIWGNTPSQFYKGTYASVTACAIADPALNDPQIIVLDSANDGLADTVRYVRFIYPADSVGNVSTPEGMTHLQQAWWYILPASACINKGDNSQYPDVAPGIDYFGSVRVIQDTIDIGFGEARLDLSTDSATVAEDQVILYGTVLFSTDNDLTRRGFQWGTDPGNLANSVEHAVTGLGVYSDTIRPLPAAGIYYYRTWGMVGNTLYPGPVKSFLVCSRDTTEEIREACFGTGVIFPDSTEVDSITAGMTHISVLKSVAGCDSVVRTVVEVLPVYDFTQEAVVCDGESYTFPDGTQMENITGDTSHTSYLLSEKRCDSLVTTRLTVHRVDTAVTVEGITLTAVAEDAAYQWVDCDNGHAVIDGATDRSYTPAENGSYAVIVDDGTCSDTSACHRVTTVAVPEMFNDALEIYPVPAHDHVILRSREGVFSGRVVLLNTLGQVISERQVVGERQVMIPLNGVAPGICFLRVTDHNGSRVYRIVKK